MSVCLLDVTVSSTKTAEPIKMLFGMWARVGLKQCVRALIPPGKEQFWGISLRIVKYQCEEYLRLVKVIQQVAAAVRPVAVIAAATCCCCQLVMSTQVK